jgi:hypothetical protein
MSIDRMEAVRRALRHWGELRAQPISDWSGEIALPLSLGDLYQQIGPMDLSIAAGGNPVQVPRLSDLWARQACYRWHGRTGERLQGWKEEWTAIAFEGSNPFIFDAITGAVYFAMAGGPASIQHFADDPITALGAIATVANALCALGDDAYDATLELKREMRKRVANELDVFFDGQIDAERMLGAWQWYT